MFKALVIVQLCWLLIPFEALGNLGTEAEMKKIVQMLKVGHPSLLSRLSQERLRHGSWTPVVDLLRAQVMLGVGDLKRAAKLAESVRREGGPWAIPAEWLNLKVQVSQTCVNRDELLAKRHRFRFWVDHFEFNTLLARASESCDASKHVAPRAAQRQEAPGTLQVLDSARLMVKNMRYREAVETLSVSPGDRLEPALQLERAEIRYKFLRAESRLALQDYRTVCASEYREAQKACYMTGRVLSRLGDLVEALSAYEAYAAKYPSGIYVDAARFFSGFLLYEHKRYRQANQHFIKVRKGHWLSAAQWYGAWSSFLNGDYPVAALALERQAAQPGMKWAEKRRARYWQYKALGAMGDSRAKLIGQEMLNEATLDWYGLLLLNQGLRPTEQAKPPPAKRARAAEVGFRPQRRFVESLYRVGLKRYSRQALRHYAPRMKAAGMSALLAEIAASVDDYRAAIRAGLRLQPGTLKHEPEASEARAWRFVYPEGFKKAVQDTSKRRQIPARWLFSFARKESLFVPDAVSHAHAVGLLQTLPTTAARIVIHPSFNGTGEFTKGVDAGIDAARLRTPEVSLDIGAWYLAALGQRFRQQLPLVAAAYNAGPQALTSWFGDAREVSLDLFVEKIPFKEARNYVKRLCHTAAAYAVLYESMSPEEFAATLPGTLNLNVRPGVDF